MCNCNKKSINTTPAYSANQVYEQQGLKPVQEGVRFKYTGSTALTAVGNITGRKYRFNHTNDIQLIDKQDAAAMRMVPVLQKV